MSKTDFTYEWDLNLILNTVKSNNHLIKGSVFFNTEFFIISLRKLMNEGNWSFYGGLIC